MSDKKSVSVEPALGSLENSGTVRVALIGVSGFANIHYNMIQMGTEAHGFRLTAATIINQEEEQAKCEAIRNRGGVIFEDYREMFKAFHGHLDLCFIPTGIHMHAPMAIAAMEAGANVFLEKPAAATIQDVRAIQAAERRTGRFVAVGYQTMFAAEALWMKEAILSGRIGAIRSIKSKGLWPRSDAYYKRNDWAGRIRVGEHWMLDSPFNNAIGHQLNMICFLAGAELNQTAELHAIQAELYRARDIESADTACMRIQTKAGIPLLFYVTHSSEQSLDPEILVEGDAGTIHWSFDEVVLSTTDGQTERMACEVGDALRESMVARLKLKLSDPTVKLCDLEVAAAQTICVNGAHESCAVREIPAQYVREYLGEDGAMYTAVKGLDRLIFDAFDAGKLFSELGVEWAQSGELVHLEGYDFFPKYRQF